MDSEHPFQSDGRTSFACLRVEGFDKGIESLPRNDLFHFRKKLFPPCGLLVFFESGGVRKSALAVHRSQLPGVEWIGMRLMQHYFTRSKGYLTKTF